MSESIIEVKPAPGLMWGVFVNDELIGHSKSSFDCDLFAEKLAKLCNNARVDHHPEDRERLMAVIESDRKQAKKNREVA